MHNVWANILLTVCYNVFKQEWSLQVKFPVPGFVCMDAVLPASVLICPFMLVMISKVHEGVNLNTTFQISLQYRKSGASGITGWPANEGTAISLPLASTHTYISQALTVWKRGAFSGP